MNQALRMRLAVALAAAMPIAACMASSPATDSTGEYVDGHGDHHEGQGRVT